MPNFEAAYIQQNVGPALAKGVAATCMARPKDPIEYLALWLMRYVEKDAIEQDYLKQKDEDQQAILREQARVSKEEEALEKLKVERKKALEQLSGTIDEPKKLCQLAVCLLKQYTSAGGAYLANLVDPEEPNWSPPEDAEEEDVESEDEDMSPREGKEGEEESEGKEEDEQEEQGEEAREEAAEQAEDNKEKHPFVDYSQKILAYTSASEGQEFVCELDLHRPPPPAEEEEEGSTPIQKVPITFRILDDRMPLLHVPNVAYEPSVQFFRKFPKVGAYLAVAVPSSSGEYRAILAADTLLVDSHGQPFTQEETNFTWDLAQALGRALEASLTQFHEEAASSIAGPRLVTELVEAIQKIREEAKQCATEGAAKASEEDQEDNETKEEGQAADGNEEEDDVVRLSSELQQLTQQITTEEEHLQRSLQEKDNEMRVLDEVKQVVNSVRGIALKALKMMPSPPPATYHILKATLLLLGHDPATFSTWKKCYQYLNLSTFEQLQKFDATRVRDMDLWHRIRSCYKAVNNTKKLEKEMPQSCLGTLLLMFVKQVRLVARRSQKVREMQHLLEQLKEARKVKEQELEVAKEAKAQAEAEAAEAAAREAAEQQPEEDQEEEQEEE